ncbi:hypothetical protein PO909_027954, partial [Leuciscus waleckii]
FRRNHVTWSVCYESTINILIPVSLSSFRLDTARSDISMRNLSFFFWALLLVDGVSGVEKVDVTVSVMEGDSVTLNPQTEIPEADPAQWWFDKSRIAKINKTNFPDERFSGRLKLDHQTGSLTITNIKKTDSGLYELQIEGTNGVTSKTFSVTVTDVVKSLSVTEGDTVTLHTGVTDIQRDDQIKWKSGDQVLTCPDDTRWRNIHLNNETGDLTIRNIRSHQSGDYELEINTASMILHRKLYITISGVFSDEKDGVKTVSETKGDVLLHTHLSHIQQNDPIEWTFGPQNIHVAKTDGKSNSISYNYNDERFKNRLLLDIRTGDLTIKNSSTEHSGLYQLKIITSSYTIQKSFSVAVSVSDKQTPDPGVSPGAVTDSGLSSGVVAGIVSGVVVLLLLVFAAVVIYLRREISELQRRLARN